MIVSCADVVRVVGCCVLLCVVQGCLWLVVG